MGKPFPGAAGSHCPGALPVTRLLLEQLFATEWNPGPAEINAIDFTATDVLVLLNNSTFTLIYATEKAFSSYHSLNSCLSPTLVSQCQIRTQNRVSCWAVNVYGRADPNCLRRSSPCLLRLKNNISPSTSCNFLGLMGEDAQPWERRPCHQSLASRLTWSIACKLLQIVKTSTQRHPARGRWPQLEPYPVLGLGLRRGLTKGLSPLLFLLSWLPLLDWQKFCDLGKMHPL